MDFQLGLEGSYLIEEHYEPIQQRQSQNFFRRANEAFSTHSTRHPHLSLLTLDEHKYHEKVNNKDGILAKQDENRKNIVHLESPTSVAKQKLRPDP